MGQHKDSYPEGINPLRISGRINDGGYYGFTKAKRQKEAKARQETRNKRSPREQLDLLDKRFGRGVGAKKERNRLHQIIAENIKL